MAVEIIVPELGESIVDATVGQWLKQDGESVTAGEPVVELETEKVNMEVPAPASGTLKITRQEGETVAIGESLGQIGDQGAGTPGGGQTATAGAPAGANGTSASANTTAAPSATSAPLPPTNGHLAPVAPAPSAPTATAPMSTQAHATPLARRVAEEHGVNLDAITGTGPGGRITQDDVTAYLAHAPTTPTATAPSASAMASAMQAPAVPAPRAATATGTPVAPPAPTPTAPTPPRAPTPPTTTAAGRREERIRMTRRRQTIAQRLKETQNTAAMLTTFNEVDMSAIMDLRKRRRDAFKERYGVSLGFMSFFTRAVIGGLKAFPRLNAEIQGNEIVLKHYYDIGIAVSTDEGLVVPVLRDADRLTFAQIERSIADLAKKAREGKLTLEDLTGGTFTITNGGTFGSLLSTPILNGTQVGILGMHKIEERPIAVKGQVEIHPMMYLAVSYDHRIVDGAEAVGFLVRVKELLEDPETLLLEG